MNRRASADHPLAGGRRAFVVAAALAAVWIAATAAMAVRNLPYRGMWWDEAAQFWVSQGISSYSPPFSAPRGVRDVARMNCLENLDPGGFTGMVRLWTAGGRGLGWLRTLPFLFFLAGSLALGALGWKLTRSPAFSVAACAAPSLFPPLLYFAFEIRAYSMENAGVAVGALALAWYGERPSVGRALGAGVACAVFLTSRYSFLFATVALGAAILLASPRRVRLRHAAAFAAPTLALAAPLWAVSLTHQLRWMVDRRSAILAPAYTHGALFLHGADDARLLARNLVSPLALPLTAALLAAVVRGRLRRHRSPDGGPRRDEFPAFVPYVAGLALVSPAASALGLYPWDVASRWSAYLVALSAVCVVLLAAEARTLVLAARPAIADRARQRRRLAALEAALAAAVVVAAGACELRHRQSIEAPHRTDVAAQLDLLPVDALADGSVFVAWYEVPMVRYLYEHGPCRGRPEYPRVFRFQTLEERRAGPSRAEGIAFLVSALPPAEARALFPDAVLRPYGPVGSRLWAVARATAVP